MQYRKLGNSDLRVSEIGFGCMSLAGDDETNIRLLHHALDLGINYFDTADIYQHGENEILLGKALQARRKEIILATKVGNVWKKDGSGLDWNPAKGYILQAADQSLKRLGTDYIDLYQLHGGTIDDPIDNTIEAFETLKRNGKILHYGISSIRPNLIREYAARSAIVSVMMQFSLLDRRPEEYCTSLLQKRNIGILARGVLGKGLLAGKKTASFLNYSEAEVNGMQDAIKHIAGTQKRPARIAIQWCLQNPGVSSAIIGIRTMAQLIDVIGKPDEIPLGEKEFNMLSGILPRNVYDQHR